MSVKVCVGDLDELDGRGRQRPGQLIWLKRRRRQVESFRPMLVYGIVLDEGVVHLAMPRPVAYP